MVNTNCREKDGNTTYDMGKALSGDVADVSRVLAEARGAYVADGILWIVFLRRRDLREIVETLLRWTSRIEVLRRFLRWTLRRSSRSAL